MEFPNFDLNKLKKDQEDYENKKSWLGVGSDILNDIRSMPTAEDRIMKTLHSQAYDPNQFKKQQIDRGSFQSLAGESPVLKGKALLDAYKQQQEAKKYKDEQDALAVEKDPNSNKSLIMRNLAKKYIKGIDVNDNMSAYELKDYFNPARTIEQDARSKADFDNQLAIARMNQGFQSREKQLDRENDLEKIQQKYVQDRVEKDQALQTPYGLANSVDDAKQLKEAHEAKTSFDGKIDQMIKLREKHKGGALLNREDVERGKQLSKDLLLEYKNMAKLGVLSKSDEDIINAIIPQDPLTFNSPIAAIQGQDPTLSRLKSFKNDSDKDFKTRIQTRTRDGLNNQQSKKTVVKKLVNQKTGQTKLVYSDGTEEIK